MGPQPANKGEAVWGEHEASSRHSSPAEHLAGAGPARNEAEPRVAEPRAAKPGWRATHGHAPRASAS